MIQTVDNGGSWLEMLAFGALGAVALLALSIFVVYPYLFDGEDLPRWRKKKRFYPYRPASRSITSSPQPSIGDAADQLRHVMGASFQKQKVMNSGEYRVFRLIEAEVTTLGNGCRVLSQTSLGEIIRSHNREAHACINSKRVDILIIGPSGYPIAAIEVQGDGHFQGSAAARDAVKKEALRQAGVEYIEVVESHSPEEILQLVRRLFPGQMVRAPWGQAASA